MKQIKTVDAVGHVLCHDLTRIVKDQYKDAQFRKLSLASLASSPKGGAFGSRVKPDGYARGSPTRRAGGRKPD